MFSKSKPFRSALTVLFLGVFFCIPGCLTTPKQEDLAFSPKTLLDKMLGDLRSKIPGKNFRISLGNFTYQDSSVPSSFARYLANEISGAIHRTKTFEEFPRDRLDALLNEQHLSQKDIFDEASASKLGKLKGVQAILMGSYWKDEKRVKIFLRLLQVETGKNLGTVTGYMASDLIPKSIMVEPLYYKRTRMVLSQFTPSSNKRDFEIQVWVDRGKSATYRLGEVLQVKFRSSRDCYLKLYHVSAKGEVQLIFPYKGVNRDNSIQRGLVYTIPDKGDNFRFRMTRPLGTEVIKAVASTTPFKEIEQSFQSLGRANERSLKEIADRGLVVEVDGSGRKGETAEDVCLYTIVE